MSALFKPLPVGALTLPNRVIMSALTRCRSGDDRVPNDLMAQYYAQRAGAGLIVSEATSVSPQGVGYPRTPGMWSEEQVKGWQKVTRAVHDRGGLIVLQLWHVGRISDPVYHNGERPVAPSEVQPAGHVSLVRPKRPYVVPRALETDEIPGIVEDFRRGAERARRAGFDGVEIHGANGYLIDQFLQDSTNLRTDRYGGSVENRARFLLEIADAVISVWGADRVGVRLRPRGEEHDMRDSNPRAIFGHVARELKDRKIAYLFVREIEGDDSILGYLKAEFSGPVIANDEMTRDDAERIIASGSADAVAFGRDYIANPDLAERFRLNAPLNGQDASSFFSDGPAGYVDYPALPA